MAGKMSHEHASFVKLDGHVNEEIFANEISGKVIPGTSKVDVVGKDGKNWQLKQGARYQWCLYSKPETVQSIPHISTQINELLLNEDNSDREKRIENQSRLMKECVSTLQDKDKLYDFLNYVLYHEMDINHRFTIEDEVFTTSKKELLTALVNCDVVSSRGAGRKLLLKKGVNIIEMEIRSDKKSLLLVSTSKNLRNNILKDIKGNK